MALATTCPQCKTSFKVVPDQLKLRRGLVRCGVCQHVFSGIDFLRYVDDAGNAASRPEGEAHRTPTPVGSARRATAPAAPTAPRGAPAAADRASPGREQRPAAGRGAARGDARSPADGGAGTRGATARNGADDTRRDVDRDGRAAGIPPLPAGSAPAASTPVATSFETTDGRGAFETDGRDGGPPRAPAARAADDDFDNGPPAQFIDFDAIDPGPIAVDRPARLGGQPAIDADSAAPSDRLTGIGSAGDAARPGEAARSDEAARADDAAGAHDAAPLDGSEPLATSPASDSQGPPAPSSASALDDALDDAGEGDDDARRRADRDRTQRGEVAEVEIGDSTSGDPADDPLSATDTDPLAAFSSHDPRDPDDAPGAVDPRADSDRDGAVDPLTADPSLNARSDVDSATLPEAAGEHVQSLAEWIDGRSEAAVAGRARRRARRRQTEGRGSRAGEGDEAGAAPLAPVSDGIEERRPRPRSPAARSTRFPTLPDDTESRFVRRRPVDVGDEVDDRSTTGLLSGHGRRNVIIGLAVLAVLQLGLAFRDELAARVPGARPVLAMLGAPLGLKIEPLHNIDQLSLEAFEIQDLGKGNQYALSAIIRNRSGQVLRWPAMELVLMDPARNVVVRKVIEPGSYLDERNRPAGIAPRSEQPIRLSIETRDVRMAGYNVALFYP